LQSIAVRPAQWSFAPAPSVWSISRIAEHVGISCQNIGERLSSRLAASPIQRGATGVEDFEIPFLFYRGDEPPNVAAPTGTWVDAGAAAQRISASLHAIADWAEATPLELRAHGLAHPVFGVLDGMQWVLFTAAHIERHRAQVIGLRRGGGFPA
jgi:hypothetical protein